MQIQSSQLYARLPFDIWDKKIFTYLSGREVAHFGMTCRYWHDKVSKATALWKALYLQDTFGHAEAPFSGSLDWRKEFIMQSLIKRNLRCKNIKTVTLPIATNEVVLSAGVVYASTGSECQCLSTTGSLTRLPIANPRNNDLHIRSLNRQLCLIYFEDPSGSSHLSIWEKEKKIFEAQHFHQQFACFEECIYYCDQENNIHQWNFRKNQRVATFAFDCGVKKLIGASENHLVFTSATDDVMVYNQKNESLTDLQLKCSNGSITFAYPFIHFQESDDFYSCETLEHISHLRGNSCWTATDNYTFDEEIVQRKNDTGEEINRVKAPSDLMQSIVYNGLIIAKRQYGITLYDTKTLQKLINFIDVDYFGLWDFSAGVISVLEQGEMLSFWDSATQKKIIAFATAFLGNLHRTESMLAIHKADRVELISLVEPLPRLTNSQIIIK